MDTKNTVQMSHRYARLLCNLLQRQWLDVVIFNIRDRIRQMHQCVAIIPLFLGIVLPGQIDDQFCGQGHVVLRVQAEPDAFAFSICTNDREWIELGSGETHLLSTEVAGGQGTPTRFDWFDYEPTVSSPSDL